MANEWFVTANLENVPVTVTKAGQPDRRHVLSRVYAGYSDGTLEGLLTIYRGTDTFIVPVIGAVYLEPDLLAGAGEEVSAMLSAAGESGVVGRVTIIGRTE